MKLLYQGFQKLEHKQRRHRHTKRITIATFANDDDDNNNNISAVP